MDIHEYQAKEILAGFGVPIPRGGLAYSPEQAAYRAREIGGDKWVVKAQVHTGGRGKAGGVMFCENEAQVLDAANELFGKKLVTHQTGPEGKTVYRLYVEGTVAIAQEFYLGFVLDRKPSASWSWHRPRAAWRSRRSPHRGLRPLSAAWLSRRSACRRSRRVKSPLTSASRKLR